MAMATKNGFGSTFSCWAAARAIGKTSAAAALLVIISVKIVVIKNIAASTPIGPSPREKLMVVRASDSAAPEFCSALLRANEQAMVMSTSQLMDFVYFWCGIIFNQMSSTAAKVEKKNISKVSPAGDSKYCPTVAPVIMTKRMIKASHFFQKVPVLL